MREVVEPLPDEPHRWLAIADLGKLIRERARDVGVNMDEVKQRKMGNVVFRRPTPALTGLIVVGDWVCFNRTISVPPRDPSEFGAFGFMKSSPVTRKSSQLHRVVGLFYEEIETRRTKSDLAS